MDDNQWAYAQFIFNMSDDELKEFANELSEDDYRYTMSVIELFKQELLDRLSDRVYPKDAIKLINKIK